MKIQNLNNLNYIIFNIALITVSVSGLFFSSWNIYIRSRGNIFIPLIFFSTTLLLLLILFYQFFKHSSLNNFNHNKESEVSDKINIKDSPEKTESLIINPYDILKEISLKLSHSKNNNNAKILLKCLASEFDIMQGAVFIYNNKSRLYEINEGYALTPGYKPEPFSPGEGLHGQAAKDMQVIKYTNLSKTYRLLSSGLGNTYARFLYLLPLINKNKCIALIEFSTLADIGENGMTLLKMLSKELGKSFINLINNNHES